MAAEVKSALIAAVAVTLAAVITTKCGSNIFYVQQSAQPPTKYGKDEDVLTSSSPSSELGNRPDGFRVPPGYSFIPSRMIRTPLDQETSSPVCSVKILSGHEVQFRIDLTDKNDGELLDICLRSNFDNQKIRELAVKVRASGAFVQNSTPRGQLSVLLPVKVND